MEKIQKMKLPCGFEITQTLGKVKMYSVENTFDKKHGVVPFCSFMEAVLYIEKELEKNS